MPRICLLLLVLPLSSTAFAQPTSLDPPLLGRPIDFSNIVGKYTLKASAAPTIVAVEDAIVLKIEIIGSGPARYEPARKSLKLIPASWENDFYIQDMPSEDRVLRNDKAWLFVYRLKPKHANVSAIPLMTLHYYDPTQPERSRFQKEYAGPIPLTVTAKVEPPALEVTVDAVPASFYARAPEDDVLRSAWGFEPGEYQWIALLLLPPLFAGYMIWIQRRLFPGQAERARRQHHLAAKGAIARLASVAPWLVVAAYLRERFDFAANDAAPAEVAAFLKRRGFALDLCRQGCAFFEACDAARFTSPRPDVPQLADEAERLIRALEADPCARG